jgi:hypothetical protein
METQAMILQYFGLHYQLRQLQEEAAELALVVNHLFKGKKLPIDLIEEMADVEIMIDQMKLYYGTEDFERIKKQKLARIRDEVIRRKFDEGVKAGIYEQ